MRKAAEKAAEMGCGQGENSWTSHEIQPCGSGPQGESVQSISAVVGVGARSQFSGATLAARIAGNPRRGQEPAV